MTNAQTTAVLDAQSLIIQAVTEAELDDFGDMEFVEPLERLVESVREEARLGEMGLMGFGMILVDRLKNRLRFQDDLKRHPVILEEDVSDPILITGMARTGTTKLQRIMGADPQTQRLLLWMCLNPAPLSGPRDVRPDPRIDVAKANADAFRQASPEFMRAHTWSAEEPEEDCLLVNHAFESITDGYFYNSPSYMSWLWDRRPLHYAYADFRRWLQYLQWQDGGKRGRPWVLKSPAHLGALDEVLAVFPHVTIVQCHRNPTVAVPSLSRLIEAGRAARGCEHVDPLEIGEFFKTLSARLWDRQIEQLERLCDETTVLDVRYDQIRDDAIGVVREIYESRGIELGEQAKQAMVRWEQDNPQHAEGPYVYTLEQYGLREDSILRDFSSYTGHFPTELWG